MRIALFVTILLIVGYELTVVTTAAGGGNGGVRSGGGGNKHQRHRHQDHHNNHHHHQQSQAQIQSQSQPMQMYKNQTVQTSAQETEFGRWMPIGEAQALLRREASDGSKVECCSSVHEMTEPEGGKNMDGIYVELYRDGQNRQRFYEVSCRPDVEDKPCRFMERRLHNQSRCVQKYSYSYALVRDVGSGSSGSKHFSGPTNGSGNSWTLDYIEVRSGCSCVLHARTRHRHPRPSGHRNKQQTASRNAHNNTP